MSYAQPDTAMAQYLRGLPKAELHIHIEGSLEPELMFELARRNGISLEHPDVDSLRAAYAFTDLQSFLDIYYAGASALRSEQDFHDMAWAYYQRAHADQVIHAELFFDPQTHTDRGVEMATVINGLASARDRARVELGLESQLILCFLRHLSEAAAFETLEAAQPHLHQIIGVGLDSSEVGHPPEKFERVFARARQLGLRAVAHAGEEGPPAYIHAALDALKVERIDHGVRCLEDPALVRRLQALRMPLTVCPLSNVRLCVFDTLADHCLPALLQAGLVATINSDDPAYFGGYMNDNFLACFGELPLQRAHARQLSANAFEDSFASSEQKARYADRLAEYEATH